MASAVAEVSGSRPRWVDQDMDEVETYMCHVGELSIAYRSNCEVLSWDRSVGLDRGSGHRHEREVVEAMHTLLSDYVSKFMIHPLSRFFRRALQLMKLVLQTVSVPTRGCLMPRGLVVPMR